MIDSPVLWGRRTIVELVLPFAVSVGGPIWTKDGWPLLPALVLFIYLPLMRKHLSRLRLVHFLWGIGQERVLEWVLMAQRTFGGAGDDRPTSLFEAEVVRRLRP